MVSRPIGVVSVMIATVAPSGRGAVRSRCSPSTVVISADLARRGPMAAARSAPVDPSGRDRSEPSGSFTEMSDIPLRCYRRPLAAPAQ
jgi:hypothetical protein